jgi:CRP-like cAMP-binding protein
MPILELLQHEGNVETFAAGQPIFREGETGDSMFAVVEGTVELRHGGRVLEAVEPGGVFGEMALIDHAPRSASAIARTDCKVARISERRFLHLVQQTPFFALRMMQVLTARLRRDLDHEPT